MKSLFGILLAGWLLLGAACSPSGKRLSAEGEVAEAKPLPELALPDVPTILTSPEERAAYVLAHFWDKLDWGDTLACHNPEYVEQNVVNFLSLFPVATQEAQAAGIDRTLQLAAADSAAFRLVSRTMERYLADPNSPMRNGEYYITYLEALLRLPTLTEAERLRPSHRLQMAQKNRLGTVAANFAFIDSHGKRSRLHATQAPLLLLMFYDPACEHCTEILHTVVENPVVNQQIAENELRVLAIYTEGDRELWYKTKGNLPQTWMVGMDADSIVAREVYDIPAMPVLYLLDTDKTVLLKDATLQEIETFLQRGAIG